MGWGEWRLGWQTARTVVRFRRIFGSLIGMRSIRRGCVLTGTIITIRVMLRRCKGAVIATGTVYAALIFATRSSTH